MNISNKTIHDFIKNQYIKDFFMIHIDDILSKYDFGKVENKPEVLNKIKEINDKRNQMFQQQIIQNIEQLNNVNKQLEKQLQEQKQIIHILIKDNTELKNRVTLLENNLNTFQ